MHGNIVFPFKGNFLGPKLVEVGFVELDFPVERYTRYQILWYINTIRKISSALQVPQFPLPVKAGDTI